MFFSFKSRSLDISIGQENSSLKYEELAKEFDSLVRKLLTKSPDAFYELYDACDRLAQTKGLGKGQIEKFIEYFRLQKEVEEIQIKVHNLKVGTKCSWYDESSGQELEGWIVQTPTNNSLRFLISTELNPTEKSSLFKVSYESLIID